MDIPTLIRLSNHLLATIQKKGAQLETIDEPLDSEE
jgi:hypothetical protein